MALISLEPWDSTWRRNQHIAAELVRQRLASHLVFVEPVQISPRDVSHRRPMPGITVIGATLRLPKRAGGLRVAGATLRRSVLRHADVIWVNDPSFGVHCLSPGQPALYDVTDDWRTFDFPSRVRRRLVRAEDRLAHRAATVVCSEVLRERWRARYGVDAAVVNNGIDVAAWQASRPFKLPGAGPHVGYIGTLHHERLDVDLVLQLAADDRVGTIHLVGPDALSSAARRRLATSSKVVSHGPVPAGEVASWTKSMDVLVSPHRVSDFTKSLDAIKSYEYVASGRPVVATPTSGFDHLRADTLTVVERDSFTEQVGRSLAVLPMDSDTSWRQFGWDRRAREFADHLRSARDPRAPDAFSMDRARHGRRRGPDRSPRTDR